MSDICGSIPNLTKDHFSDDILLNVLPAQIRARIFSALPLRLIKLPEIKLTERSAVAEYIIQNKLNDVTEEIYRRMIDVLGDWDAYTRGMSWHKTRFHNAAISAFVKDITKFAVLSHTWGQDEPSYEDFVLQRNTTGSKGYEKLEKFCKIAYEQYGVEFAWADTVCINKLSSSELDESIRSMFTWYRESSICIIYLADTETLLDFPFDRWFTRGWTLQELLAPLRIKCYNKRWQPLTNLRNEKLDPNGKLHQYHPDYASHLRTFDEKYALQLKLLVDGISAATGIPIHHIYEFQPGLQDPSLPERMKWIAQRVTTRPEDISYSMMGVLGVSISIAYGEGLERAFFRLFQAVLEVDWSPSWFLWGGKPIASHIHPSRMIPSSPACYLSWDPDCDPRSSFKKEPTTLINLSMPPQWDPRNALKREPIALTNTGLPIKVLIVPARVTHIATGLAVAGPNKDANITCPLSDDTIKMVNVQRQNIHHKGEHQFAFGILDHDLGPWSNPERVYGILLRRYYGPYRFTPLGEDQRRITEWMCAEWERWETGGILSFALKDMFRGMESSDLTKVQISRSEVGWSDSKDGRSIAPKPEVELRSLYL